MRLNGQILAALTTIALVAAGPALAYEATGKASWYGSQHHGRKTASGERFDMYAATAAHRTLPLGSVVEVTNLSNDRTIKVKINDRGPFSGGRLIDLSKGAAEKLGFISAGTAQVRVRTVGGRDERPEADEPAEAAAPMLPERPMVYVSLQSTAKAAAPAAAADTAVAPPAEGSGDELLLPEETKDGSRLVPVEVKGWAIQAGTFAVRENAEKTAALVGPVGATEIRAVEVKGRTLYKVLVGAWASKDQAAEAVTRVAEVGFADARVVSAF